jgi:nickel/cobalt transporter (NicO) family protein
VSAPARRRPVPSGRRLLVAVLAGAGLALLPLAAAGAHPLGNFTVNHYAGLRVAPDRIRIDYVVDLAEIPAFQARQQIDGDGDGRVSDAEAQTWRERRCDQLAGGLRLSVDGRDVRPSPVGAGLSFPPGAGGLPTLRLECSLVAVPGTGPGTHTLGFADGNDAERVGWREISAIGEGATLTASDVPTGSASARLTRYPSGALTAPLRQDSAHVTYRRGPAAPATADRDPAAAASGPRPLGTDRVTALLAAFVSRRRLTAGIAVAAIAAALVLGAVHALAPGHGKSIMAAYLLGARGRLRQALTVAATVTITHTAGVLALGLALTASSALAPERCYPWLGLASGLLLTGLGVTLLRRARHRHPHAHDDHGHGSPGHHHAAGVGDRGDRSDGAAGEPHTVGAHAAGPHAAGPHAAGAHAAGPHAAGPHAAEQDAEGSRAEGSRAEGSRAEEPRAHRRGLVAMGFVGGLSPSPSALVVLLAAIALHRTWFGLLLVGAYGAGMSAALTGTGLLLSRTQGILAARLAHRRAPVEWLSRAVPAGAGAIVLLGGLLLAARNAVQI